MMNTMKALIKREFWEHRGAFIKTPIIIGIVLLILYLAAYVIALVFKSKTGSDEMFDAGVLQLAKMSSENLGIFWDIQIKATSSLFFIVMFFILFFYLLGSLYDDRKDQSILFWKSLPISDAMTVTSKILIATIFMPFIFMGLYVLYFLAQMIEISIILLIHGLNPIKLVWIPVQFTDAFKFMIVGIFVKLLWGLPIYGWLIFSSAVSKRRPFLFAVLFPTLVGAIWYFINVLTFKFTEIGMFSEPLRYLGHTLIPFSNGSLSEGTFQISMQPGVYISDILKNMFSLLTSVEIIYGIIFFAVFFTLSIWVRRYRNTI